MVDTLVSGRQAVERRAWHEAMEAFSQADQEGDLSPDDLRLMAEAAWWSGSPDQATEALERSFAGYVEGGRSLEAAEVAARLAYWALRRSAPAIAGGWVARAERLLANQPESGIHGLMKVFQTVQALFGSDVEAAIAHADEAIELGERYGNREVETIGRSFKGAALAQKGEWKEGLALVDEASTAAMSGELDLAVASDVYCNTIAVCRNLADYRRAGEWTEEAERWMRRHAVGGYPGVCQVHRAELKRLRGSWSEAEQEARRACEELERYHLMDAVAFAHYEVGEVRLRMGDLAAAEEAFQRAYEYGWNPQPGLSRLALVRGRVEEAAGMLARAIEATEVGEGAKDLLTRARLLPARVEIALARGDAETARQAVEELEQIAEHFGQPALEAAALSSRGAVLLEDGEFQEAVQMLDRAWRVWRQIDLPYESARARLLLGRARLAAGEETAARLELRAARSAFQRLGAVLDLEEVTELLDGEAGPRVEDRRATKTFMFTDIVTSTDLVGLIGDSAWEELLRWHDRALRSAFAQHRGEEVSHTGDGFFVAFDRARDGVECAVAIQRRLAEHRREHGFAPWVRIGLHAAEATKTGTNYSGHGVHAAARVGALGDKEEIVVSVPTLQEAGPLRFPVSEPRTVTVKGVAEPVEVASVDWR